MNEVCKISTSITSEQDFILARWIMAQPSQDWGLIQLGNQSTWEIRTWRENQHHNCSVLLSKMQKHLNKQRNYPYSWNQSSHLCHLMSSSAFRAQSLKSPHWAVSPQLQHTKMLWDTRNRQSLHICLADYWVPTTKKISYCFHTFASFFLRHLNLFFQSFPRAGSWSSQPGALLSLANDL